MVAKLRLKFMREILKLLREEDGLKLGEIMEKLQASRKHRKTVIRALKDLVEMDLVRKRGERYFYRTPQALRVFTKEEYELALKHSRIILGMKKNEEIPPYIDSIVDFLAAHLLGVKVKGFLNIIEGEISVTDMNNFLILLQHIRTGYEEIYVNLLKYADIVKKLHERKLLVNLELYRDLAYVPFYVSVPKTYPPLPPELPQYGNYEVPSPEEKELSEEEKKLVSKFKKLKNELIGQFVSLCLDVIHGEPLKGKCKYCPHLKIRIIEAEHQNVSPSKSSYMENNIKMK